MNLIKGLALAALLLQPALAMAEEEEKPWSVDLSTAFFSDYMYRGFNLFEGASIQPSVTASYDTGFGTLSGNLWSHVPAESTVSSEKFFELDETLSYSITFDPVTIKLGHVWYTYPDDSDDIVDSAEFFGTIVLDDSEFNPFALTPTVSVYEDYRAYDAQYYELGVSHEFTCPALGESFNLTPFAAFGFASNAEKVYEDNGLVQVTTGASTTLSWGVLSIVPSFNYTFKVDELTTNEFWFGTSIGYTF